MGILDRVLGKPKDQIQSANDQGAADKELASFVRNRFEEARTHPSRIAQEGIWMTNIAYLLGYDGIYYDPQTRQFKPASTRTPFLKRNRIFVNKILPSVQNRLARLCKNPPKFDIRPNGPESDEKDLARLKQQVLEMIWDKQHLNIKRQELLMWVMQCGHAYIHVGWDAELGEILQDPETGEQIFSGDIRNSVVSAFETFPDPIAKNFDDLTWIGRAKVRKLDYFRTHYPEIGQAVKEENAWLLSAQYEQRINALNNINGSQGSAQQVMKNSAIELSYYERRSKEHPNGRLIIVANGVLLHDDDLPVGELPFAKFDDILIGGKYCSEAVITHLRPLQDHKNRLLSARQAFVSKLLTGKYIAAKGHGLSQEALNDQSGEVVEFTPVPNAPPPQPMTPPQMPQYVYTEEAANDKNFDDIIGINEVSKGQLPSAQIPAIGMQLLTEQDDTRIGIMTESHEESWARVGRLNLLYAQKFFKTPRILKIAGKSQDYVIKRFTGDDLLGDHDVIVIRGSTLPGSKTLRRQEIINAWQQGLLGDPADPRVREKVLGMLEWGDAAEMWEDYALDQKQVKDVTDSILAGTLPDMCEYDNIPMLWVGLNRFRKAKREVLTPDQQNVLEQAMQWCEQDLMAKSDPNLAAERNGLTMEKLMAANPLGPPPSQGAAGPLPGGAGPQVPPQTAGPPGPQP